MRLSYMIQVGEGTALTTKSIHRRRRSICRSALPAANWVEARARFFLFPREAEEEARELDAVVERRGREVRAAELPVQWRGDGVNEPDQARGDRYPRVAEGIQGLVTPSRELAPRGGGGDVAVSVTRWDDARRHRGDLHGLVRRANSRPPDGTSQTAHHGALPGRHSRWRRRRLGARRKGWRRRRQRSSGGQLGP